MDVGATVVETAVAGWVAAIVAVLEGTTVGGLVGVGATVVEIPVAVWVAALVAVLEGAAVDELPVVGVAVAMLGIRGPIFVPAGKLAKLLAG